MSCKPVCKLCNNLVLSSSISFTGGNLIINLPANSFRNGDKVCIVTAQVIPATTTVNAPVYVTIGTGSVLYPLTTRNCRQVTACGLRTRTKYCTCVVTNATGGTFRMIGNPCCTPNNQLASINGTAPVADTGAAEPEPTT